MSLTEKQAHQFFNCLVNKLLTPKTKMQYHCAALDKFNIYHQNINTFVTEITSTSQGQNVLGSWITSNSLAVGACGHTIGTFVDNEIIAADFNQENNGFLETTANYNEQGDLTGYAHSTVKCNFLGSSMCEFEEGLQW